MPVRARSVAAFAGMVFVGVVLVGVVLVVAACSGGSGSGDTADAAEGELTSSPINDLLGIDPTVRETDLVELERSAERGVAECMAALGFTYVPVDLAARFDTGTGPADPDTRAYAEANGYGIATEPNFAPLDPADFVDPNDEIRAELSETELAAYLLALYGDAPVEGEQIALDERTGCVADAYRAVYAVDGEIARVESFFDEFGTDFVELEQRFRADPRYLELEEQWVECMSDAGYDFAEREDIFTELNRRLEAVAVPVDGTEPSDQVRAELDAVAAFEREVAVADWDCTQPIDDELRQLRFVYEELFLRENADRIDAIGGS